jgi:hypothetical protein
MGLTGHVDLYMGHLCSPVREKPNTDREEDFQVGPPNTMAARYPVRSTR